MSSHDLVQAFVARGGEVVVLPPRNAQGAASRTLWVSKPKRQPPDYLKKQPYRISREAFSRERRPFR